MHVIINRVLTLGQKTGIGHYTAQLLRSLKRQAGPGEKISGFPSGWVWRAGQMVSRPLLTRGEKDAGTQSVRPNFSLWRSLRQRTLFALRGLAQSYLSNSLHRRLHRHAYDLYHEPNTIPLPCDVATVATLHDLSVLLHPEWHPTGRVAYFEKNLLPSLARCSHYLAVSEFTRRQAIEILHLPAERVTRVYNGIRPDLQPLDYEECSCHLRHLGLTSPYLLYVGTIEPRKNALMLLKAYCALPAAMREKCPLVLAGGWGWSSESIGDYYHETAKDHGVVHLGYVPDEYLPALYNGARALVYPSFYEGFGLPPMEMMACGGAVLASTADALVETVGSRAHLIEPDDRDGWLDAMQRMIEDDDWWRSLRSGTLEVARPFTWERTARGDAGGLSARVRAGRDESTTGSVT